MEKRTIRFYVKEVWGKPMYYPVDFQPAIETLTGQKTLVARTFSALEALGFQFVEILNPERKDEYGYPR
jgi:hypothetical protein